MCDASEDTEANGRDTNCSPDISSDGLKNVNSEDGLVIFDRHMLLYMLLYTN